MPYNNSNDANTLESMMDRIKTISSTILSIGFILYTIGYLIVNINLSRYGAHEIGLLEPSYLISGIFFLFFWFVPIFVPALIIFVTWSMPLEGMENYRVIRVTNVVDFILLCVLVLLYYLGVMAFIMILLLPTVKINGEDSYVLPINSFWFILIQLVSLGSLFIGVFNKPYKDIYDLISKRWPFLSIIGLLSILLFIKVVFPTIPTAFGGGKPEQVCLGLYDATSSHVFSNVGIGLKEDDDNWTEPLWLGFEGENALTILLYNDKNKNKERDSDEEFDSSIRINKDLIASIRYKCSMSNAHE